MENKNTKKRSEHLTTTIGDLMKLQGNDILKTEKKPYKKNKKYKKNFKNDKKKIPQFKSIIHLRRLLMMLLKEGFLEMMIQ